MAKKEINDIKGYHKNPRKITEKMFNTLSSSLEEYGDLSGIVVNIRTGEAIGGNQRTAFFKQHSEDCEIEVTKLAQVNAQGTVAYGYVVYNGEKFNYREVDWDEKKSELANILANKVGGFFDTEILANQFELEDLKMAGFEDFELGFVNDEEIKIDTNDLSHRMEAYLEGSIKQVVIYFSAEQFDDIIPRFELAMQKIGVENHTDLIIRLLEEYEGNNP